VRRVLRQGDPDAGLKPFTCRGLLQMAPCSRTVGSTPVQEVLLKLVCSFKTFEYDPQKGRFRGWLKTVTNNLMAELKRQPPPPIDGKVLPDEVQAEDDLEARIKAMFDLEQLAEAK